jgi:hypothetical protein
MQDNWTNNSHEFFTLRSDTLNTYPIQHGLAFFIGLERYHVPLQPRQRSSRIYTFDFSRRLPSFPPSFLTTPFGPQIVDKNLWTILEYLEISSRALSIFLCVNSLSDTLFVTRSISGYPTLFLSRLSLNVKKHPPPQPCSSAHSERTIAWRRL